MPCQYTFHQGLPRRLQTGFPRYVLTGLLQAGGRAAALTAPLINCRFKEIFMRGVIMHGPGDVRVEERERPQIVEPTDAIIRVPASCICGSDLWPYRDETNGATPMGHEYVGIVEEVGDAVPAATSGTSACSTTPNLRCRRPSGQQECRRIRRRSQWWGTGLWVCWQCWPPSSSAPSLRLARWLDDTDN